MRAAVYRSTGPAAEVLRVEEIAMPEPGPGQVRVRIVVSGVNPTDWKSRSGATPMAGGADFQVPNQDGAGVVDAVGAGVDPARVGQRVWLYLAAFGNPYGTAAEYSVVPQERAVPLPDGVDFDLGANLGVPALTAHRCLYADGPVDGRTVLVAGGAGAVGHYAIQFAKLRGARVLTTVSGAEKATHASAAGADAIINYRDEDVTDRVKSLTDGRGVDAIVEMDLTRNGQYYPGVLRPFARVVVYGMSGSEATLPSLWMMQNSIQLRFIFIYEITPEDRTAVLAELTDHLAAKRLKHTIARRLPLARVAEAHDLVEAGKLVGNVVLDIA